MNWRMRVRRATQIAHWPLRWGHPGGATARRRFEWRDSWRDHVHIVPWWLMVWVNDWAQGDTPPPCGNCYPLNDEGRINLGDGRSIDPRDWPTYWKRVYGED